MDKEQLQANIDIMKLEIAKMEAQMKESDKVVLEYKDCQLVINNEIVFSRGQCEANLLFARYRDTKEQAEETILRELQANRIEALAKKLEPDWKADWNNNEQRKCTILFDHVDEDYYHEELTLVQHIGVPCMSKQTAETICDYLNSGRYSLDKED